MKGINNIKKRILITIFTFLFLIRFIYSEYPIGISPQNNAVSSLGSNSIIQWIINSSVNGYSTVAQYIANFISIKGISTHDWAIITFLMTTLLFIAVYLYIFEIFTQKVFTQKGISESKTMQKAKILFVFALSVFSAIAIGYAIPFLFSLYGFILLILLLIALFFFGRATISYGKSFYYSIKSFEANVENDLSTIEKELNKTKASLSSQEANYLKEGAKKASSIYYNIVKKALDDAENKLRNTLTDLISIYQSFIENLINQYNKKFGNLIKPNSELQKFIDFLEDKKKSLHPDMNPFPSLKSLYNDISKQIPRLNIGDDVKRELIKILDEEYDKTIPQISSKIDNAKKAYDGVEASLQTFKGFGNIFKKDFEARFRYSLGAPGNKAYKIGILSGLDQLEEHIREAETTVKQVKEFLDKLLK
jgi:F0F1-type ATP synthase membrane subunit b/b'